VPSPFRSQFKPPRCIAITKRCAQRNNKDSKPRTLHHKTHPNHAQHQPSHLAPLFTHTQNFINNGIVFVLHWKALLLFLKGFAALSVHNKLCSRVLLHSGKGKRGGKRENPLLCHLSGCRPLKVWFNYFARVLRLGAATHTFLDRLRPTFWQAKTCKCVFFTSKKQRFPSNPRTTNARIMSCLY